MLMSLLIYSTFYGVYIMMLLLQWIDRLYNRYIMSSNRSKICGTQAETDLHSLLWCKYATDIWLCSPFYNLICDAQANNFADLLLFAAPMLDSYELTLFLSLKWASWWCRNKAIYEDGVRDAQKNGVDVGWIC